ncbi:MAG: hypothetical protein A3G25_09225 [Betaproteobacteria bacterium RIFCSPLOWO2_12_FULL_63_13]|nr:MAG: hypothetical protein A3H32_13725 [Betaproteobacteria bacterium RIFCSPLOWO2_02_FULL_63_19]OGA45371.1 MAG: hypothetical protein A3G25_09225 [Betaproteobacteria bacterium RIFCSPLOWO2_12_FULL_63_13]
MNTFFDLIDDLTRCPQSEAASREQRIRELFETEKTVLALDMSGFTVSVRREGIIAHLCKIRRMQLSVMPLIGEHRGELVKCEADNALAVFDDSNHAVSAALAINREIIGLQQRLGEDSVAPVGIGIDSGPLLLIPGRDCYGDPVNIAFKLAEDIARPTEILITETVQRMLAPTAAFRTERQALSISGMAIAAYRVLR